MATCCLALGCLSILALLLALLWLRHIGVLSLLNDPTNDMRFSSAVWKAAKDPTSPSSPRYRMLRSLERDHLRRGMTRSEILVLLGKPDATAGSPNAAAWWIGRWGWIPIDGRALELEFDKSGRLVRWFVWES